MLTKNCVLFERDENGELIPKEVKLEVKEGTNEYDKYKDETVIVTPMTRGEIRRMFSDINTKDKEKDLDSEIILKHCKNPAFTESDLPFMKQSYVTMIVDTVLRESGLLTGISKKKALDDKEDEFGKN